MIYRNQFLLPMCSPTFRYPDFALKEIGYSLSSKLFTKIGNFLDFREKKS